MTATPVFAVGASGQEIHVENIGIYDLIFHDSRGGGPASGLVLDTPAGGSLNLRPGDILQLLSGWFANRRKQVGSTGCHPQVCLEEQQT